MQEMINALPAGAILALDEAYIEAAPDGVAPPIDVSAKNVLRFRTFSKLYGMAGARIGYVIGHPELISAFDKVRNHYGVNLVAQRGALAALQDQAYLADVKGRVEKARNRIGEIAYSHGLEVLPSATNFVTIDCGRDSNYAREILSRMLARGVFLRMPGVEPLARCIRVSVGLDHELDLFEEQFSEVLDEMKASK
jgi:histidinol-phosphate aminotransferase